MRRPTAALHCRIVTVMLCALLAPLAARSQVPVLPDGRPGAAAPPAERWMPDRETLRARVGRMSQVAGVERLVLDDGPARGVRVARVSTGSGLVFDVLLDRGMDLGPACYNGRSLCWQAPAGVVAPQYHDPQGLGWLKSFGGGLLVTCGLANVGGPLMDEGESLGLHGRVSHIPASNIIVRETWEGGEYVLSVEGEVREAMVHFRNLRLHRRVWTRMGARRLWIEDTIANEGFKPTPVQLLYHFNLGYPVVDDGAAVEIPTTAARQIGDATGSAIPRHRVVGPPSADDPGTLFLHEVGADAQGNTLAGVVNLAIDGYRGLGVAIGYRAEHLPYLAQWKLEQPGQYLVGLEPTNTQGENRDVDRARGALRELAPGETLRLPFEVRILDGQDEIDGFRREVAALRGSPRGER